VKLLYLGVTICLNNFSSIYTCMFTHHYHYQNKPHPLIMQPHSHGNHGFSFSINDYRLVRLTELQQSQHPQHNEPQRPQYHPPQHQQQGQGHVLPTSNPHVHASSILSYPTFDSLFEKQVQETNQVINNQVKIYMYHNF